MTDEERGEEGAEEDLEAPTSAQGDVAGGFPCQPTIRGMCVPPNTLCLSPVTGYGMKQ
jgi:hypothetical protein